MEKTDQKSKSLKKKTKNAMLGVAVATTLGTPLISDMTILADTQSNSSEIYSIDNPYRLIMDTLKSEEFKQACIDKNPKGYPIF